MASRRIKCAESLAETTRSGKQVDDRHEIASAAPDIRISYEQQRVGMLGIIADLCSLRVVAADFHVATDGPERDHTELWHDRSANLALARAHLAQ